MRLLNYVSKTFKRREAIKKVSLNFDNNIYGLLGSNGAGKTTLLRCILGLYKLNSGEILYNGKNINNNDFLNKNAGYLPQKFGLFKKLTTYDMLSFFENLKGIPKDKYKQSIEECVEQVNLTDRLYDRVGKLSGGMIR